MKKIFTTVIASIISLSIFFTSSANAFSINSSSRSENFIVSRDSRRVNETDEKDIPNFSVLEEENVNESPEEKAVREEEEAANIATEQEEASVESITPELEVSTEAKNLTVRRVGSERERNAPTIRRVIRLSPNINTELNFEELINLQNYDYLERAFEIAQLFQQSLDTNTLEFNLDKAMNSVRSRADLKLENVLNKNITKKSAQPAVVADELIKYLQSVGVNISSDKKTQYTNIIASAFSNLKNKKESAWIFWNKATSKSCSYNYNILFAIQDESTGNKLVVVPVALKITVNVVKEKILFIKIREKHSYNVNIKALRVSDNKQSVVVTRPIRTLPDRPSRTAGTTVTTRNSPIRESNGRRTSNTGASRTRQ